MWRKRNITIVLFSPLARDLTGNVKPWYMDTYMLSLCLHGTTLPYFWDMMAGSPSFRRYDAMVSHPFNPHFPIICLTVSSTSSETNQESAVFTRANQHIVYLITPVHTLSVFTALKSHSKISVPYVKTAPQCTNSLWHHPIGDDAKTKLGRTRHSPGISRKVYQYRQNAIR